MDQGLTPSIAWGFTDAIMPDPATTVSQDAIATVSRRDADGTVWVAFDGATSDTPVSTVLSAVSVGERVRVSIHGGRVTIVGNSTSPGVNAGTVDEAIMPTKRVADASISLAREAKLAANSAVSDAGIAKSAAEAATRDAATAKEAAESAVQDARVAHVAADEAKTDAISARISATDAKASAERANTAANDALTQLSVVEDVAGTLSWISEHGTFTPTTDASVQEGTVYFSHDDTDYVPVVPTGDEDPSAEGWYVLDVTESQADYVMSHLAVTASGLWVLPGGIGSAATPDLADGYKMLLANDGAYVYDGTGHLVTKMGESIELDSERPQHIGGEDAYILYYDSDDDGMPDSIVIGGERVSIGGRTLTDMFDDISQANAGVEAATEDIQSLFEALDGKADGTSLADLATSLSDYKTDNDAAWANAHDSFVTNATLDGYVRSADYKTEIARLDGEIDLGVKKSEVWTDGEGEDAGEWAWETLIRLTEDSIQSSVSQTYATKADTEQTGTLAGTIVTAGDALAATPRGLTVYGSSTQDGTPTPESPVAIESVDELALCTAGRNMFVQSRFDYGDHASAGITWTFNTDGTWAASGTTTTATSWAYAGAASPSYDDFKLVPAGTYTASVGGEGSWTIRSWDGTTKGTILSTTTKASHTFTLDQPTYVSVIPIVPTNTTVNNLVFYPQLELGSTATEYEPYVGTSTPIDLQGHQLRSLPDGTRDELAVDSASNVTLVQRVGSVDLGTLSWTYKSNGYFDGYSAALSAAIKRPTSGSELSDSMCQRYTEATSNSIYNGTADNVFAVRYSNGDIWVRESNAGTDPADFKSAVSGMELIYPLATPQTIDLGTIDLPTLPSPEFTAWTADATDLRLEYWRTAGELAYEASSDIIGLSSTVTQQAGSITSLIESTEALSTMVRQYGRGVLVGRVGQGVGALVSADGSFDVVPVEWDGSTPTAGTPITTIGADVSRFGEAAGFHIAIETVDEGKPSEYRRLAFYDTSGDDGTSALVAYMTGGMLYVENSMVLSTMRIGDDDPTTEGEDGWEWIYQPDKNLTLKWRG